MKKINGVHAPHRKNTAGLVPEEIPVPSEVTLPMSMHSGKPAKLVVNVGDSVKVGQLIGEADGIVSSPVHASVSGKIKKIDDLDSITGKKSVSVTIESDGKQEICENITPPNITNKDEFIQAVQDSGVVGLGGAGYPTNHKLTIKDTVQLDYILINGAECEPYITSDTRAMIDDAEYVLAGALLMNEYLKPKNIVICIENNKPEAIKKMRELCADVPNMEVRELPSSYPQGERKVLYIISRDGSCRKADGLQTSAASLSTARRSRSLLNTSRRVCRWFQGL